MRLKALREKRGISQLKLAMDLDMNQNSISRYETGAREADYKSLIKFADYFDVSIDYLLERTDNPKTNFRGDGTLLPIRRLRRPVIGSADETG